MIFLILSCTLHTSMLFVIGGKEISSQEGTAQGDPIAMAVYQLLFMH